MTAPATPYQVGAKVVILDGSGQACGYDIVLGVHQEHPLWYRLQVATEGGLRVHGQNGAAPVTHEQGAVTNRPYWSLRPVTVPDGDGPTNAAGRDSEVWG